MSIAMLVMVIAFCCFVCSVGCAGFLLGRSRLPPSSTQPQDRRLVEQSERIEILESELRRVRDQADFTERLLTERGGDQSGNVLKEDVPD